MLGIRKIFVLTGITMLIPLTACSSPADSVTESSAIGLTADILQEENVKCTLQAETEESVAGEPKMSKELEGIPEFEGELDFTYVFDTDAQAELGEYNYTVYTQDGYYQLRYESNVYPAYWTLYYCTGDSNESVIVCSKSNCEHRGQGCDAYFSAEEYLAYNLWYYQENLYTAKMDEDYVCLYKISPDGAVREKSCTLMRQTVNYFVDENGQEAVSFENPKIQIHRGYAYFTDCYPGCNEASLYRVKLDSDEEMEVLFTMHENYPYMLRIQPYGRYVMFQMGNFDDSYLNFAGGIYAYDTENGSISQMSVGGARGYCIYKNALYYIDFQENVLKVDLETGETSLFYESQAGAEGKLYTDSIFNCGENLVFSLEDSDTGACIQQVFDETGTIIDTVEREGIDPEAEEEQEELPELEEVELLHPYTFESIQ